MLIQDKNLVTFIFEGMERTVEPKRFVFDNGDWVLESAKGECYPMSRVQELRADESRNVSHGSCEEKIERVVTEYKAQLATELHPLVDQLASFEFGRFLLVHRGVNGPWIDYVVTYPEWKQNRELTPIEESLLNLPITRATQGRYQQFLTSLQGLVKEGVSMCSVPCGVMTDLLRLDFEGIESFELVGLDIDPESIMSAQAIAQKMGLEERCEFFLGDAWRDLPDSRFDVVTSNGLNCYVHDSARVEELYAAFAKSLKPGGVYVGSFLTHPPAVDQVCEWQMENLDPAGLKLQKELFHDILDAGWHGFASTEETTEQLKRVGFIDVEIFPGEAGVYPTVVAYLG